MKALILAAGRATRLYPMTAEAPKCLLDVGGKPLLARQLDALAGYRVGEVLVVTGYHADSIRHFADGASRRYPFRLTLLHNPLYAETNNLYSAWIAREELEGLPCLILHADVLFHKAILTGCLASPADICLVIDREIVGETMKVTSQGDRITAVRKSIPPREATGTFIGIAKFSGGGSRRFFEEMGGLVQEARKDLYFTAAVERLIAKGVPVGYSLTEGLPWMDIDTPEELEQARTIGKDLDKWS